MENEVKILLAEDDINLGFVIQDNLEQHGFQVVLCKDGEEALASFTSNTYRICLLDVMMPKMDGFSLATAIRARDPGIPILFITAKTMKEDRLRGFLLGGDDYITKPFSIEELILRIRVFLKRPAIGKQPETAIMRIGQFIFDPKNLRLTMDSKINTLTRMEAEILGYLAKRPNQVIPRKEILEVVWGNDDYFTGRSLDVFISRLRKLISSDPSISIANHHGVGFALET